MKTTLTVIVDNKASNELSFEESPKAADLQGSCSDRSIPGEWGLSILAEFGDSKILADVGGSKLFASNLSKLGFDIKDIDYATLSHAHSDHAGGMAKFFADNEKAKFYLRETAQEKCYIGKYIFRIHIGIPRGVMSKFSDRIEIVSGDYKLCEGAWLIPHKTPGLSEVGKREKMYRRVGHRFVPDDFSHEQSLVLDTDKGLVIINCCSHGGVVNIINEIRETFPDKHIYGIVGGFHLYNKSNEEIKNVAQKIEKTGIEFVCTGHCTKDRAYKILKEELGEKITQMKVGMRMEF